jgi:hypothetical protein
MAQSMKSKLSSDLMQSMQFTRHTVRDAMLLSLHRTLAIGRVVVLAVPVVA